MMKLTKKLHIITLTLAAVAAMLLPLSAGALSAEAYATESRLASGRWVKIKVTDSGLYAISKSTAQSWNTASSGESFRAMGLSFRLALLSWRKA